MSHCYRHSLALTRDWVERTDETSPSSASPHLANGLILDLIAIRTIGVARELYNSLLHKSRQYPPLTPHPLTSTLTQITQFRMTLQILSLESVARILLLDILIYIALNIVFIIRYWHHLAPRSTRQNPHTPTRPWETNLLQCFIVAKGTVMLYAFITSIPPGAPPITTIPSAHDLSIAIGFLALILFLARVEEKHFQIHVLQPYLSLDHLSQPRPTSTSIHHDEEATLEKHDDLQKTLNPCPRTPTPAIATIPPPHRCSLPCRLMAALLWPMTPELVAQTPNNLVARYHIRAFLSAVSATVPLNIGIIAFSTALSPALGVSEQELIWLVLIGTLSVGYLLRSRWLLYKAYAVDMEGGMKAKM